MLRLPSVIVRLRVFSPVTTGLLILAISAQLVLLQRPDPSSQSAPVVPESQSQKLAPPTSIVTSRPPVAAPDPVSTLTVLGLPKQTDAADPSIRTGGCQGLDRSGKAGCSR